MSKYEVKTAKRSYYGRHAGSIIVLKDKKIIKRIYYTLDRNGAKQKAFGKAFKFINDELPDSTGV